MKINSDNPAIEKSLKTIKTIIEDEGGYVDPEIVITSENGGISLEKHDFGNPVKPILAVPVELLLDMEAAGARIENDEFICAPQKGALTGPQHKLTEHMFEIYNLTNKAALHRRDCLWFAFRDSIDVLEKLLETRTLYAKQKDFYEFAKDKSRKDDNEILCDTYFKSRTIGKKQPGGKQDDGIELDAEGRFVQPASQPLLMPIIDFCNHHHSGSFFNFKKDYEKNSDREFLLLGDHRPMPDNNECFAFYNQLDPIDSFLSYCFPDAQAPYVRSVPLEFELPKLGKINVRAMPSSPHKGRLPENAQALRPYIPHTIKNQTDALGITHIMIPTNFNTPQALRRVLRILITNRAAQTRTLVGNQIWDAVLEAEDIIINKNVAFYKDMISWLDKKESEGDSKDKGPIATTRMIAEMQLTKLYKYNFDESKFSDDASATVPDEAAAAG